MNKDVYEFSHTHLRLYDEQYGIDIAETFDPPLPLIEGTSKVLFSTADCERAIVEIHSEKDGVLFEQYGVKAKKKHGRYRLFFPTGKIAAERWYIDDVLWGRSIDFYPEGMVKRDFGYRQGKLQGPFRFFRDSGVLVMKGSYIDGKAQGLFQLFDAQGQLMRTTSFEHGRRKGADAGYTEDGYMLYLDFWSKGEKLKSSFFDCTERFVHNEIASP